MGLPTTPIRIPPPPFQTTLSVLDARYTGLTSRRILVFKTPNDTAASKEETVTLFTEALQYLVQKLPVLGGRAQPRSEPSPTGQTGWGEIIPGDGIILHIKDHGSKLKYSTLEAAKFHPTLIPDNEFIPVPVAFLDEPYDISHLQLNFIEGGILLSFCIAHMAADGVGDHEIIRLMAQYTLGVQEKRKGSAAAAKLLITTPQAGLDRSPLLNIRTKSGTFSPADHACMKIKPPAPPAATNGTHPADAPNGTTTAGDGAKEPTKPVNPWITPDENARKPPDDPQVARFYRIKGDKLAQLKQDATTVRISTTDVLMSVIWRAQLVNRIAAGAIDRDDAAATRLFFPIGMRKILGLPQSFVGNAVYGQYRDRWQRDILAGPPLETLQQCAADIRAGISEVGREQAASYLMFAESAPNAKDFVMSGFEKMSTTAVFGTSFYHADSLLECNWGDAFGGRPVRLRCSDVGFTGPLNACSFVMPRFPEELDGGGTEVFLPVFPAGREAMEKDEIFGKYFETEGAFECKAV